MTRLKKVKDQSIFWITVFIILVQVCGQTENTAISSFSSSSSCGGVLELSSGALDFPPVGQNGQKNPTPEFCIWIIKLPATPAGQTIQFQLIQIPQGSKLNLYSPERHVPGQLSVLPIASLTTADINRSIDVKSSNLVLIWTPSRVKNEGEDSSSLLSFTWDEVNSQGQGQRSSDDEGRDDQVKDLNLNWIGGVNYVEADRGRFSWVKPGKGQQNLLWVLNRKSSGPLDLKIETDLEDCNLTDPCLCSFFGVYQVYDSFLRAVSTECGRSSNFQGSGIGPHLVALGFVHPDFRRDTNHVTLSWNSKEPEEGTTTTTTTTEITTTTTTEPPKTCASGTEYPKSCSDFQSGPIGSDPSQLQNCLIYPNGPNGWPLEVLCDFQVDGGGWTVIQKRTSGPREQFNRTWDEYSAGFGSLDGNFWVGLDNIHALTKNGDQELRIEMQDFYGYTAWTLYSNFQITDASGFYRVSVSGFDRQQSTAGDSMTYSGWGVINGVRFSTRDKENDEWSGGSCLDYHGGGGWWFNQCAWQSHLNGPYQENGELNTWPKGIWWFSWKNQYVSLAKTEMKVRKRNPFSSAHKIII